MSYHLILYHALSNKTYKKDVSDKNKQLLVDVINKSDYKYKIEFIKIIKEYYKSTNEDYPFDIKCIDINIDDIPIKLRWILYNYIVIIDKI